MKNLWNAGWLALAAILSGCAGTDFVRPDPGRVTIGKSTQDEVLKAFGAPWRQGLMQKHERSVTTLSYAYAEAGGSPYRAGVTPARAQGFHFHNGILVGQEFVSSWATDHTDFDETKVGQIVKGKTTRDEVQRLFGRPGGNYVYPMIKSPTGNALVYTYTEVRRTGFVSMSVMRKELVVTLDAAGIVEDVEFTSTMSG